MEGSRVLVADDHPLAREGLALAVRHAIADADVAFAGSIADAEALVAREGRFALILLDLMLPDATGFSGFFRLRSCLPNAAIVIITARDEADLATSAKELGAAGFLSKSAPLDELAAALRQIVQGLPVFPATGTPMGNDQFRDRIALLSGAQRRVLFALADGRSNKQIAYDLDISEATVKAHLTTIFRRLGVTNRSQAMLVLQPLLGDMPS